MTAEEAIQIIKETPVSSKDYGIDKDKPINDLCIALNMAIKALECQIPQNTRHQ